MKDIIVRRYIVVDESGHFDLGSRPGATRYLAVGTVTVDGDDRRETLMQALSREKYALAKKGEDVKGHLHATEDRQVVRDRVYQVLLEHDVRGDVTLLDKPTAQPHLRETDETFNQYARYFHCNRIAWGLARVDELVVVASSLGTTRREATFRRGLEDVMDQKCPEDVARRLLWWRDESDHCLQAADYLLRAVTREKERGDGRSRQLVERQIDPVFEPFSSGTTLYY